MGRLWGLLAAAALLWPGRIIGPLDGVPLDRPAEAVLIGVVFPALWWVRPEFLATRLARTTILGLLAWKAIGTAALTQDGWCVRIMPDRPYALDARGAPHGWDLRADWRSEDPACTAIMARTYHGLGEFPVWFFNLPPPNASWPEPEDRPPLATASMTVHGYLYVDHAGVLHLDRTPDVDAAMSIDGGGPSDDVAVSSGVHVVHVDARLSGSGWRFIPLLNGSDLWMNGIATVRRPGNLDLPARRWLAWFPTAAVVVLLGAWLLAALRHVSSGAALGWSALTSVLIGSLVLAGRTDLARWMIPALATGVLVPVPRRLQNLTGAFVMVGIPWLTFVVAQAAPSAGRFTLYEPGTDFWMFQRFAYRIVMQGYWLQGGSSTFWFQPLYRWIAGLLHMVFGDSSVGEAFWDGTCLLVGALFSCRVARVFAGFRWGLIAAVGSLAVFTLGTAGGLIGIGLGEITSAGFACLAVLLVMKSRHRDARAALVGGALATAAFYTRLNNLPMAIGVAVFAIPLAAPARALRSPSRLAPLIAWRSAAIVVAVVTAGVLLFAWRTWYYTGVFSASYGTQQSLLAIWQPGIPARAVLARALGSVMMVLTVNDPARFDPYALPVLAGAAAAVLGVAGVPFLKDLPLAAELFFFTSIAGALVARGSAYEGRFSVHVIPITCALTVCAIAGIVRPHASRVRATARRSSVS
jgi:hypothetical protein